MGCGVYWDQVHELERAMATMERFGVSRDDPAYQQLYRRRGELMAQVGTKGPRDIESMSEWFGLSPQKVRLWHDVEAGWMVEIRDKPGALPRYKYINDELAMAVKLQTLTPAQKEDLLAVDYYVGE